MKILYTIPWSGRGGSEAQYVNLLRGLKQSEEDNATEAYTITGSVRGALLPHYQELSREVFFLDFDRRFDLDATRFMEIVTEVDPDIIHIMRPGGEGLARYVVPCIYEVPIVVSTLCDRDEGNLQWADAHIVPSYYVASIQRSAHANRQVVYYSVTRQNPSSSIHDEFIKKLRKQYKCLGFRVGTLDETKRVADAVEAVRGLDDCCLIVAGRDIYSYFGNYIKRNPLPPNVYYIGEITESDKWYLLHHTDLFIYPTTREAFGVVFIEAAAAKLPVLTYDDSANSEVIGTAGRCILVSGLSFHSRIRSLRQAIKSFYDERASTHGLPWRDNRRVVSFSFSSIRTPLTQWLDTKEIYEQLLQRQ